MSGNAELLARVRDYLSQEIDDGDRAELEALIANESWEELSERFSGGLTFGTAGIRGILGAGESRMNRAAVIRVSYGVVRHVLDTVPDAACRGVAIARDGRHRSAVFQRDAAAVAAGLGVKVLWLDGTNPTPLLAFAVRKLGAACGIVITASHNPPEYNGYKVYWSNGAQIVPPVDRAVAAEIENAPRTNAIPRDETSALIVRVDTKNDYRDRVVSLAPATDLDVSGLRIAYSALHGVAQPLLVEVLQARGFRHVFPVTEQAEPDGDFKTVRFPNPEEAGALDLVLAEAKRHDCPLVLVNDPDGDRLGAAVRAADGGYVPLSGNEIGTLMAHYVLAHTRESKPLVVSTIVSTRMVEAMCRELGVRYEDTLTGFKWITNDAMRIESAEDCRFVFGFEEALGFTVGTVVRDKDGISAALVLAEMAAGLAAKGETLLDALERLRERFGFFVSRQKSLTLEGAAGTETIARAMKTLRKKPLSSVGGESVARHDRSGVLLYDLERGGRIAVRPSGTEPKLKFYMEVCRRDGAEALLDAVERDMLDAAGLGHFV